MAESTREKYAVCVQCRSKKIRCGREKPSCANCNRLGLLCEWSGQGKKHNQTALLSNTILAFGHRLQHLETSISDTQKSLKRLFEEPSDGLSASVRHLTTHSLSTSEFSIQWPGQLTTKPLVFTRKLGRFLIEHNNCKRYFGPTSMESILLDTKDILTKGIELESHSLRECVVQAERKIDLLVGQREEELIKDDSPPTMPPFAILDAMIESYFTTINHTFPIWTKERFNQIAIAMRQSESSEKDLASIICCNNLILMALSANSLRSHRVKSPQMKQAQKISSIDFDVIEGFLTNAKRALKNLDQIISPRVINVQALISLVLVAQEFLSVGICETLFTLAVRCAKSVGIHQWHSLQGQISDEDIKERQNISYCLYVLDKAICWIAGSSPNIPISEVQVDSTLTSFGDCITSHLAAKAELAKIEEKIYLEIYASQVEVKTAEQVRRTATAILSRLQAWLTDREINLDEIQKDLESSAPKVELAIRFLCAQLLLIWPYKCHPDATFQQSLEIAKICMKLLLRLWNSPPDQGDHAFFPLFLASLPPLYLYEVSSYILCGHGSNLDIDLLRDYVEMLQMITNCRRNVSYNRQLYQMSRIVIDVTTTQNTQPHNKRQKSTLETPISGQLRQSDHASLYDSTSDLFSLPITGFGHLRSDVRESEDQGFDSAAFQDPVNSFVFMDASASPNDDITRSSGDFSQHMGPYAKGLPENLKSLGQDSELIKSLDFLEQ